MALVVAQSKNIIKNYGLNNFKLYIWRFDFWQPEIWFWQPEIWFWQPIKKGNFKF